MFSVSMRRIWYGSSLPDLLTSLPDLLLAGLVGGDGERHELLQRHAVLGIDVVQLRRHGRQAQALLDDRRRDEEAARRSPPRSCPCRAAVLKARN